MAAAEAAADGGEDPWWRRSNTDCAPFLASRSCCTKGAECEYRHCDGARFNFRSCWYWFQGNCVNPSCTFRHPPLETLNQTKSPANPLSSPSSTCAKSANLCYFYYNSYCAKGDHCPFLHEPLTCNNAVETCSEATTLNPTVNGSPAGDEMVQSLSNSLANPSEDISYRRKEHLSKKVTESRKPEIDGAIPSVSETSADTGAHMKSSIHSDQSSEHSEMEYSDEDEQRDSSPGFDVLVDDRDSNMNDLRHQLSGETDFNGPYVEYDGRNSVDHGPDYLDSECYEREFFGFDSACYPVDPFYLRLKEHDTVSTLGHLPVDRIKLEKSNFEEYGRSFIDPRNFISSVVDAAFDHQYTESRHSSRRGPDNRKGSKGRNSHIKRRRGFESSIGSEDVESRSTRRRQYSLMGECSRPAICGTFRGQKRRSKRKQHHRHHSKSAERATKSKQQDCREDFTGPKTLAQIKEEKRTCMPSSQPNVHMPHGRSLSNDFEGPKSLSELLKAKGMTCGGSQCRISRG